jgi:hypothetical protein
VISAPDTAKVAELHDLLAGANSEKRAGFYSDFDPESGSWSSPGSVTEAEFAKIRPLISEFVSETRRQLNEFIRHLGAAGVA